MTSTPHTPDQPSALLTPPARILIASDHAGVELKQALVRSLGPGYAFEDLGPSRETPPVDYPDLARDLALKIQSGQASCGILICGSGIGMSIAANKFPGIRATVVENPVAARLSREHNDCNVLCLGSRFLAAPYAAEIVRVWLTTSASPDPRHRLRIEKIKALESLFLPPPSGDKHP
jgi:RpiB/LacA/LacB family sugar-phosphate isomerase